MTNDRGPRFTAACAITAVVSIALAGLSAQGIRSGDGARALSSEQATAEMGGVAGAPLEDATDSVVPGAAGASNVTDTARPPYTFFPQAGIQGQDLFVTNYVDVNGGPIDSSQPGLDYECTGYSYSGHSGH